MIKEISLKNVASYKNEAVLRTDKKVNLIYGLNGAGKSTFSNYFYDSQDPKYKDCSHIGSYDKIIVYNQRFIKDNFYSKDSLKGIFSLSKENKEANIKIDYINSEIDKLIKKKDNLILDVEHENKSYLKLKNLIQDNIWEIKTKYAGGDRILDFCLKGKIGSKESLLNYISSIQLVEPIKTISDLKIEANTIAGEKAQKYKIFKYIMFMNLNFEEHKILNEIIVGSHDTPISKLINELKNSDWVSEGLNFLKNIDDQTCPFCQSKTINDDLVEKINSYFDESYKRNLSLIEKIKDKYISSYQKIFDSIEDYSKSVFNLEYLNDLKLVFNDIKFELDKNLELINQKIVNPSFSIKLNDIDSLINKYNSIIELINLDIEEHNRKIDNKEDELKKIQLEFWNILRYEYRDSINIFIESEVESKEKIKEKDKDIEETKDLIKKNIEELNKYQESTVNIHDAIKNINQDLKDIGITDFYIEKYENFYRIVRVDYEQEEAFSSLSEGEKTIISFLYFKELFKGKESYLEGDLNKIAIIDDPVSSLSHIFVYNIGRLLKKDFFDSPNVKQVFILTHSLYFFYEITDIKKERRDLNQKLFRLSKNNFGTLIKDMKYEEIQNDYQSYWSVINDKEQPPALIANCMRNIVEYFFSFVKKEDLSNILQKQEFQTIRLQSFLRYMNRESHSLGQNIFDFKEFNYEEFREGLSLLFEHAGYSDHYKKMAKIKM